MIYHETHVTHEENDISGSHVTHEENEISGIPVTHEVLLEEKILVGGGDSTIGR